MFKARRKGFTFIELLIAITIFSIIAAGIYQTMRLGVKTWERTNLVMRQNRSLRAFFNGVSKDLVNSVPASAVGVGAAAWEADSMAFPAIGPAGITQMRYRFDKGSGSILRSRSGMKEGFDMKLSGERVILRGAEDAAFEYAAELPGGVSQAFWQKAWEGTDKQSLPGAVRITVTLKKDAGEPGNRFEKIIRIPNVYAVEETSG